MSFSDAQTGGTGFAAYSVESIPGGTGTPGVAVTPNLFLPVSDKSLKAKWEQAQPTVMRNTRMSKAISERTRLKPGGKLDYALNPALGLELILACLGAKTTLAAIAAVATTASITTANGVSTVTAPGTWIPGTMVLVGVTSGGVWQGTSEARVIATGGNGTFTCWALNTNAAAASGLYVTQPAQDKYANSLLSAANLGQLPTLTVDDHKGNWSWRYPGMYVDQLDVEFGKDATKAGATFIGSADPVPLTLAQSVSYAPNATDEKTALRPLTSMDGQIVAAGDPDATGSSSLRAAYGVTDVKIAFKNAILEEPAMNGSHTYLAFPGDKAECSVDFTEISTSKRPDVFTDLIQAGMPTTFAAAGIKNYGTATQPIGGVSLYIPTFKFTDQDGQEKIGSVNQWQKKGEALAPPGAAADYLQVFVLKPS